MTNVTTRYVLVGWSTIHNPHKHEDEYCDSLYTDDFSCWRRGKKHGYLNYEGEITHSRREAAIYTSLKQARQYAKHFSEPILRLMDLEVVRLESTTKEVAKFHV